MNSSTTLLGQIIVTSAVEKREAVELSDNSSYLTYIAFFMTPTVCINFFVNFFKFFKKMTKNFIRDLWS